MNINEIIEIAKNKLLRLQEVRNLAYANGDIDKFYQYEQEIADVQVIIDKLAE